MYTLITMQMMVDNYLSERRRLGFQLRKMGNDLTSFARYIDNLEYRGPLTLELMAAWAKQDKWHKEDPATWSRRIQTLRPFARYLQQFEPHTEIPDESIFGKVQEKGTPHIYHKREIIDLLAAAKNLGPDGDLRAARYETLFGLIASAGLRVSEAVSDSGHLRATKQIIKIELCKKIFFSLFNLVLFDILIIYHINLK